ncbi:hypothetical protein A2Y99_01425 [Candidatus Gottesmanbacteria bacterium RBG_13_37_7]|uniref:Laminin G domain-containing protein n=1 Tax=Candidatus Gottesmanbacteria bacterium RBG_13_37_7 TaxID=1798369 RepID=A0A1F5YID5_9BACT|nr:MAG: hypothetical protein A2Y99_01425 [Candidatus Gottesmanbacteria bacterium RBG_13_37_7]
MKKGLLLSIILLLFSLIPIRFQAEAEAPIGNYLILNGGYLKSTTDLNYSPSAFTFETWIKPVSVSGIQTILSIGNKNTRRFHYEVGINGGSLSLRYHYGIGSQNVITAGNISSGTWSHIAVSITSSYTRLFINGIETYSTLGADNLLPIGESLTVANSYLESSGASNSFKGEIDEIRISEIERDVSTLWDNGTYHNYLIPDHNTVILWHLDESRGKTVTVDGSHNSFNADLVGGDAKIHFYGVLPSPTPIVFPTSRWQLPTLPAISFPSRYVTPRISVIPTVTYAPTSAPFPTINRYYRPTRPVYSR